MIAVASSPRHRAASAERHLPAACDPPPRSDGQVVPSGPVLLINIC